MSVTMSIQQKQPTQACPVCSGHFPQVGVYKMYKNLPYHTDCLRCAACNCTVGGKTTPLVEWEGRVLCGECNQRCTRCSKPLLNECLIVNDRQYHQGCHTCLRCNVALGEECYVLDNDVACRKCAEEVQAMREAEK